MKVWILCLFISLSIGVSAQSADKKPATQQGRQVTQMMVHPAGMSRPALKYRLLPDPAELTQGNAATMYLIACSHNLMIAKGKLGERPVAEWITMPASKIPRDQAMEVINSFHGALRQVEIGARREECHWDLPARIEGFSTLLPHLSDLKFLSQVLALQARLQIADGQFSEAAHTLQTGFGLARHLNQDAFTIQKLVASAIAQMMLEQTELWIQAAGAPNLYWGLAELPHPFSDLRGSMELERATHAYAVPHMKEAAEGKLSVEHLSEMLSMLAAMTDQEEGKKGTLENIAGMIRRSMQDTPAAREFLRSAGYTDAAIDAMQPAARLGLYYAGSYDYWMQEMTKWFNLPYPQALVGLDEVSQAVGKAEKVDPGNLMFKLLPAIKRGGMTTAQLDRRIAMQRCLEVARSYAADHEGKVPGKLEGMASSPAPVDPITGEAFGYEVRDGGFVLEGVAPPGGSEKDVRRYEVRVGK